MTVMSFVGAASAAPSWQAGRAAARRADRLRLLAMLATVGVIALAVPWLANAYWTKTLTSALALSVAASGVALL